MAFSSATYVPGDAWTSTDFLGRALTPPKLEVVDAGATDTTTPSYFEYRQGTGNNDPFVEISIYAEGALEVVLERSFDNGVTWRISDTFTENTEERTEQSSLCMLRLRVVSGTDVYLALRQG